MFPMLFNYVIHVCMIHGKSLKKIVVVVNEFGIVEYVVKMLKEVFDI